MRSRSAEVTSAEEQIAEEAAAEQQRRQEGLQRQEDEARTRDEAWRYEAQRQLESSLEEIGALRAALQHAEAEGRSWRRKAEVAALFV